MPIAPLVGVVQCLGAQARVVDKIANINTLFTHLMIATLAHFCLCGLVHMAVV